MPKTKRRKNLPLNRDKATTKLLARNVQESASNTVQDLIQVIEDFILNGISSQITPKLQLKFFNNEFAQPQILKDGRPVHDQRFSAFNENGYYIIKNYRGDIRRHLQELFPQMTWSTELGSNYIGITIGNYGIVDSISMGVKEEEEEEEDEVKNECK